MNTAKDGVSNDRLFCWEQVARTNPAFRVSQVFATREDAAKLLPLYALFSIVEQICSGPSDEDLACSKLNWWRIECSQQNLQSSHHPVLKEFRRTGATQRLGQDLCQSLFEGAQFRLEANAPADISGLKALCIATQRPQFDLEISISGLSVDSLQANQGLLARGGLLQLIRESSKHSGQGAYWWIPLNLLARYGVSRDALVNQPESEEVSGLFSELISQSASWAPSGQRAPENHKSFQALRNYFAINGLYSKKISALRNLSPDRYVAEISRIRVSDLFVAWRCARRLLC